MPNIAIYEGGKAARMNGVSRITTDDGNDGKIVWVPQSDRQTGTLYVSENGTYRAEDEGLHSWSKVTVRLAGAPLGLEVPTLPDPITGAEIPTGELGELEPVPPAGLEPIEDEPISVDEAEKILDEAGLDPSDLESDDALEAIADALGTDPDNVKVVYPEKKEDVKKEQPKVEDKGQKATGTDPATGEPATITPSGKEGTIMPDELRILVEPSRKAYVDGDTIDYSGLQCALYKDGQLLRTVPLSELGLPMTTAQFDGSIPEIYTDGEINAALYTTSSKESHQAIYPKPLLPPYFRTLTYYVSQPVGTYKDRGSVGFGSSSNSGSAFLTVYDGFIFAKGQSGYFAANLYYYKDGDPDDWPNSYGWLTALSSSGGTSPTNNFSIFTSASTEKFTASGIPVSTKDPRLGESGAWHAAGQKQDVPVNWHGLSDSFQITVTTSS